MFYQEKYNQKRFFAKENTLNLAIEAYSKEFISMREDSKLIFLQFQKFNIQFYIEEFFIYIMDILATHCQSAFL